MSLERLNPAQRNATRGLGRQQARSMGLQEAATGLSNSPHMHLIPLSVGFGWTDLLLTFTLASVLLTGSIT